MKRFWTFQHRKEFAVSSDIGMSIVGVFHRKEPEGVEKVKRLVVNTLT